MGIIMAATIMVKEEWRCVSMEHLVQSVVWADMSWLLVGNANHAIPSDLSRTDSFLLSIALECMHLVL